MRDIRVRRLGRGRRVLDLSTSDRYSFTAVQSARPSAPATYRQKYVEQTASRCAQIVRAPAPSS